MKNCIIKQPAGIGDILSIQKIAKYYSNRGFNVIFPVKPQLLHIQNYIKYHNVTFIDVNDNFIHKNLYMSNCNIPVSIDGDFYFPLESADKIYSGCVIRAKYKMARLDWDDWSEFLTFERDIEKEYNLYYNILGLTDDDKFNLINKSYGTLPNNFIKSQVKSNNNLKDINLEFISNFTIFDWCTVFEKAYNIYTVDTSILFLIEKLNIKATNLQLWSRHDNNYTSIDGLFKKKWINNYI